MATSFANFSNSGVLTIDAVANRIIRIRRLLLTSDVSGQVEVKTDYGGAASSIGPIVYLRQAGSSVADLPFEREPLTGARGMNVAVQTTLVGSHSVLVEYDVVD